MKARLFLFGISIVSMFLITDVSFAASAKPTEAQAVCDGGCHSKSSRLQKIEIGVHRIKANSCRVYKGMASYYGKDDGFNGKQTANQEIFNMRALTAAHKKFPFGTKVIVKLLATGREVIVRINDRGPFVGGRIIDLTYEAARRIGLDIKGVGQVELRVCG